FVLRQRQPQLLVSGGDDGRVHLWTLPDLNLLGHLQAHRGAITFLGGCADGDEDLLITCSDAYVAGRVVETLQVKLWGLPHDRLSLKETPQSQIEGPRGYLAEWCAVVKLSGRPYLLIYYSIGQCL